MMFRKATAYLLTWTEAEEALQEVLDDSGINLERDGLDLYWAGSDTQRLDAGQVDERIAQYLGTGTLTGWAYEDGIVFIDNASEAVLEKMTK